MYYLVLHVYPVRLVRQCLDRHLWKLEMNILSRFSWKIRLGIGINWIIGVIRLEILRNDFLNYYIDVRKYYASTTSNFPN